ncbi:MAG: glycosyltransferase family 4 protein [Desulfomonilaceae bacterium]
MALEKFDPYAGGVEAYAVGLARELVAQGWEVHLYGYSWANDPPDAIFHQITPLPRFFPSSIKNLHFALRHREMVMLQDFDVVLGFGNTLVMNVYQSHGGVHRFSVMRKIDAIRNPLVRIFKRLVAFASPKYYARAWIEGAPFRAATRPVLIAISEMVKKDLCRYFGVKEDDVLLIYNGADQSKCAKVEEARIFETRRRLGFKERLIFLFMAYDLRKKGAHYLLEAAKKLKVSAGSSKFGVLFVGGAPSSGMRSFVKKHGLTDNVVFLGPTTEPELYFRACDVLVLPTFYDACSLVVFEALAAGTPVITTRFNGAAGAIREGVTGFILESPRDTDALANAMEKFLDRQFLARAKEAAQTDSRLYRIEDNYRKMIDVFTAVARRRHEGERRCPPGPAEN